MSLSNPPRSLPWEVLSLVASHLDPKTLAIASCVSKSWSTCLSSDHLWQPICTAHYPSLSAAFKATGEIASYRRLYSVAHAAAKRRAKPVPKPHISLSDLVFTVHLSSRTINAGVVAEGKNLPSDPEGLFRVDVDLNCERWLTGDVSDTRTHHEEVKVTWNVVLRGWEAVFTMMNHTGKVSYGPEGAEGWFSDELPAPECCVSGGGCGSGIAADLKLGFSGKRLVKLEKASVGMLSIVNWRYLTVDDGLRYLQHFLLPCDIQSYF